MGCWGRARWDGICYMASSQSFSWATGAPHSSQNQGAVYVSSPRPNGFRIWEMVGNARLSLDSDRLQQGFRTILPLFYSFLPDRFCFVHPVYRGTLSDSLSFLLCSLPRSAGPGTVTAMTADDRNARPHRRCRSRRHRRCSRPSVALVGACRSDKPEPR